MVVKERRLWYFVGRDFEVSLKLRGALDSSQEKELVSLSWLSSSSPLRKRDLSCKVYDIRRIQVEEKKDTFNFLFEAIPLL